MQGKNDVLPLFNAMGDRTRQRIITVLAEHHRLTVGELTQHIHLSRPAISHHIKVLREVELVVEHREGTKRYYQPTFVRYIEPMRKIIELVDDKDETCKVNQKGEKYGKQTS